MFVHMCAFGHEFRDVVSAVSEFLWFCVCVRDPNGLTTLPSGLKSGGGLRRRCRTLRCRCITLAAKGLGIPVMGVIRPKCVREKLAETGRSALAAPDLVLAQAIGLALRIANPVPLNKLAVLGCCITYVLLAIVVVTLYNIGQLYGALCGLGIAVRAAEMRISVRVKLAETGRSALAAPDLVVALAFGLALRIAKIVPLNRKFGVVLVCSTYVVRLAIFLATL